MASKWASIYRAYVAVFYAWAFAVLSLAAVVLVLWTVWGLVELTNGNHRWYSWRTIWLGPVFIPVLYGMYRILRFSKKFFYPVWKVKL
jgi:hypothetical protein